MGGRRILVVDDDDNVRDLAFRILRDAGYEVRSASTSEDALTLAEQDRFDLVVTDIKMPGMSGVTLFKALKALDPDLAGVIITAHGSVQAVLEALHTGFDAFVNKPFMSRELLDAVDQALEKRRFRQEYARFKALVPIWEISQAFMTTVDLDELLTRIVNTCVQATGADRCSLMLLQPDRNELRIRAATGLPESVVKSVRERVGEGIAGYVVQTGQALLLNDPAEVPPPVRKTMGRPEIFSALSVPLILKNRVIGVLNLSKLGHSRGREPFTESDRDLVSILASHAAIAIENARLFAETQQAYRELKELDRLKSEFINIASHELRTPLAIINAYAELLETEVDGTARNYLKALQESAAQLGEIVNDLVNLQHLERGEFTIQYSWVDPGQLINTVLRRFIPLAESKQHQVEVRIADALQPVRADERKLDIVLSNLLSNAIKFTPPGGKIVVEAYDEADQLVIAVHDTGIGIPQEAHERIFDRFYQVQDSLTRQHGGLGVGLTLVKGLLELHGGRVWLESAPGQGSSFYISIPRSTDE